MAMASSYEKKTPESIRIVPQLGQVIHPMTYSHYIGLLIYHFTEVGKCPTFFTSRNTFKWGIFSPFFLKSDVM
jgi:desulfoferrodoxin (superoxide reductase-like protein)